MLEKLGANVFTRSMTQTTHLAVNKLAPEWSYRKAHKLLLKPKSKKVNLDQLPYGINTQRVVSSEGTLQAYHVGNGPAVLLIHSWNGGAYQYFALMRGLAECGFKAISFDHFGHGNSSGGNSALHRFINGVNIMLKFTLSNSPAGMAGIVAHSMGTVALVNAKPDFIGDTPIMLVSPIFRFRDYFSLLVNVPGLHPQLCNQYLARFEKSTRIVPDRIGLIEQLPQYASQTLLIHDKNDQISSFRDSLKFISDNPSARLYPMQNLGHDRIIQSESVWLQLKALLNYREIHQLSADPTKS